MKLSMLIVLVALAIGCTSVVIPHTPEGMACSRDCMAMRSMCVSNVVVGCSGQGQYAGYCQMPGFVGCNRQQTDCFLTCPGAYVK